MVLTRCPPVTLSWLLQLHSMLRSIDSSSSPASNVNHSGFIDPSLLSQNSSPLPLLHQWLSLPGKCANTRHLCFCNPGLIPFAYKTNSPTLATTRTFSSHYQPSSTYISLKSLLHPCVQCTDFRQHGTQGTMNVALHKIVHTLIYNMILQGAREWVFKLGCMVMECEFCRYFLVTENMSYEN